MKHAIGILIALASFSCGSRSGGEYAPASAEASADMSGDMDFSSEKSQMAGEQEEQQPGGAEAPAVERQIIRTVDYRFQVKDVAASSKRVKELTLKYGGYISEENTIHSSYELNNYLAIRTPAPKLDTLLEAIGQEAVFTNHKRITARDVTEEYLDVETRLRTKKEVRDRYIDILRNRAQKVEDILDAEEKIRVIQEEIEVQEGRMRYLRNQVAYSTINLNMYQPVEYRPEPDVYRVSFTDRLTGALSSGWRLTVNLLLFLLSIWPLLIIGGLLVWQRRRIFGRWRRKS